MSWPLREHLRRLREGNHDPERVEVDQCGNALYQRQQVVEVILNAAGEDLHWQARPLRPDHVPKLGQRLRVTLDEVALQLSVHWLEFARLPQQEGRRSLVTVVVPPLPRVSVNDGHPVVRRVQAGFPNERADVLVDDGVFQDRRRLFAFEETHAHPHLVPLPTS